MSDSTNENEPTDAADRLGVVVVDHGSRRDDSNQALERFVERFAERSGFDIVEPAHMELAEPSIETAVGRCVARGATRVVVCPFFLLPGKHWTGDLPRLTEAAARRHPGVQAMVSAPIGGHDLLIMLLRDRVKHCLARQAHPESGCDVCRGEGGCHWLG